MGIEVAIIGAALIGAGSSVVSAQEAKKDAAKQRRIQEQQARLQARLQDAQLRRQRRIAAAKVAARQGGAVTSSAVTGQRIGAETQLGFQQQLNRQQLNLQTEQFALQESQTASQANAAIGSAVGSFTSTLFSPVDANAPSGFANTTLGKSLGVE